MGLYKVICVQDICILSFPLLSALLKQCVKKVRVISFSGPHFPTFRLNTEIYFANVHIKGQCGKMQFRETPNMGTFYTVQYADSAQKNKFYIKHSLSEPDAHWSWFTEEFLSGKRNFLSNESHVSFPLLIREPRTAN